MFGGGGGGGRGESRSSGYDSSGTRNQSLLPENSVFPNVRLTLPPCTVPPDHMRTTDNENDFASLLTVRDHSNCAWPPTRQAQSGGNLRLTRVLFKSQMCQASTAEPDNLKLSRPQEEH